MQRFAEITSRILEHLPMWFKMSYDKESIGAQFLNVTGLALEDIEYALDYALNNHFIGSADISQPDIIYKAQLPNNISPSQTLVFHGGPSLLIQTQSIHEFLLDKTQGLVESLDLQNLCYVDQERNLVYVRHRYEVDQTRPYGHIRMTVKNNGVNLLETFIPLQLHHIWNYFDEFGLLLGTARLYGEYNSQYKERILDVFRNPGGTHYNGLINVLSRELGIQQGLSLHELHNKRDVAFQNELYTLDKHATPVLQYYVDTIINKIPLFWGHFTWGDGFWDIASAGVGGQGSIPSFYDASIEGWDKWGRNNAT